MNKRSPRFVHDCNKCVFTGHYNVEGKEADGWYCSGAMLGGSIILRYGNDASDYSSVARLIAENYSGAEFAIYRQVVEDYAKDHLLSRDT